MAEARCIDVDLTWIAEGAPHWGPPNWAPIELEIKALRSIAAFEDVTLSSVASRALRDFTTQLTASAPATSTVHSDG